MEIFRIHKTKDYTVISTRHLKETNMSLKAKGLMSTMLSLPDDWDLSVIGLSTLSKDGKDSIMSALDELKRFGYLKMESKRNAHGQFETVYEVYEEPFTEKPNRENRCGKSESANPLQYNIKNNIIDNNIKENNKENNIPFVEIEDIEQNEQRENSDDVLWSIFWETYDKKVGKDQAIKEWKKISRTDKMKAIEYLPGYKDAQPDKQYRKNPSTYLHQKSWNDELIRKNMTAQETNDDPNAMMKRTLDVINAARIKRGEQPYRIEDIS